MSGPSDSAPQGLVPVQLLAFPLATARRSGEYHDGLVRELTHLHHEDPDGHDLPVGLKQLIDGLRGAIAPFTAEAGEQVARAAEGGAATVDVLLHVPGDIGDDVFALDRLLDQADAYCRAGQHLLTLTAPPHVVAYRKWLLSQFIVQADGGPPTPCPASATEPHDPVPH